MLPPSRAAAAATWFAQSMCFHTCNDKSPDEMMDILLESLSNISDIFIEKKSDFKDITSDDKKDERFSSKNKIPRQIRILLRNKSKLSKRLLNTKSTSKYLKTQKNIEVIDKK